ncbi:MAG: hypothetical protein IH596_14760 [Bacteroidales bacterium]|nr:hypothetical protein [Bacteroidales bacterium]
MNNLDKFIRNHAEMFDDQEPAEGHFDRFEQRLERQHASVTRTAPIRMWMKIAAGIIILITAGLAISDLATHDFSKRTNLQEATLGLPDELIEVLDIYQRRSDQKMTELNQLALNCPNGSQLIQTTQNEVDQLNKNMDNLVSALKENPSDNRVQNALIQNCKAKESLLSDVILQEKMKKCNE